MARQIPCQAVGCGEHVSPGRFMCRSHWYGLPAPLRQHIDATWRARKAGQDAGVRANAPRIIAHVEAGDEARRWTADVEGKLADYTPDAARIRRLYELADDSRPTPAQPDEPTSMRITGENA